MISEEDLATLKDGTVVIRSHGVGRKVYDKIKNMASGMWMSPVLLC